ncbi:Eco57I restriction-modification methylase domain-containing protein [uncultured Helicobacter sp.]|uniref:type IIG restriction enzyme/methyltransferase n=1 Tax=uncultured Helicobacter sp. TaxID=175537 RepID=UPI00374E56BD
MPLSFHALAAKDFLSCYNPSYAKSPIIQKDFERFCKALQSYLQNLKANANQNEPTIVANTLKGFFDNLGFESIAGDKQEGKSEIDLSLRNNSDIEVIIEAKKGANFKEMFSPTNTNCKALHECILYYLRERDVRRLYNNTSLQYLIITNFYDFYIFESSEFRRFFESREIQKLYENFTQGRGIFAKDSNKKSRNEEFYKELSKILNSERFLDSINRDNNLFNTELKGLHFSLRDLNHTQSTNSKLKLAYKIFHKDFLHREFRQKDSNELDKDFYKELLYIMGLEETKERKLIPSKETLAHQGTLYAAIARKLGKNDTQSIMPYLITWLNRILFLKLIEANLVQFNDDTNLCFLDSSKIPDFATLNHLFFDIFAKDFPQRERREDGFYYLPYLNSSLFEKQEIEKELEISKLDELPLSLKNHPQSVLKERYNGDKPRLLTYLLDFLNAFDFGKQKQAQSEEIPILKQTPPKLIKSSILGSFFELLNGYEDGSFYTPSFITSYMCERAIERVVLDKFNKHFELKARNIKELERDLRDFPKVEVKRVFLEIKICDPAVGSGYFLVSALHTLLKLYEDLNLFENDFRLEILDDEVLLKSKRGNPIYYKRPDSSEDENHQIQKELFRVKKELIESCLFGVDINPNSCEIARLRLWIELLKHSYYTDRESNVLDSLPDMSIHPLATLPNIDINIKCGNSLVSYFDITQDLKHYPNIKAKIQEYQRVVQEYKEGFYANKQDIDRKIKELHTTFKNFCFQDKFKAQIQAFQKECDKYSKKYGNYLAQDDKNLAVYVGARFDFLEFDEKQAQKDFKKLQDSYNALFNLESNKPFEWRFAFPEVLDSEGDFRGFDLVIGNPPYIKEDNNKKSFENTKTLRTYQGKMDIWYHFVGRGFDIAKNGAIVSFIATNNWTTSTGGKKLRNVILKESKILSLLDFGSYMCFDSASIQTMIMAFQKLDSIPTSYPITYAKIESKNPTDAHREAILQHIKTDGVIYLTPTIKPSELINKTLTFADSKQEKILEKMQRMGGFYLEENEIQIGIGLTDKVKKRMMGDMLKDYNVGDGVFQITTQELKKLQLSQKEMKLIKPLYTTNELFRFYANPKNKEWIIYTDSSFKKPNSMDNFPNLKKHLDKFQDIITSDNKPYGLHRAKQEYFFNKTPSIISLRKCPKEPIFTYVDFDCYVTSTFFIIQTQRIDMKYLTGILNSKLVAFWLRYRGKMQGNHYQIDKEPLLNIPIPKITESNKALADKIIALVEQILESKAKDSKSDTTELENKIDSLVYALYNLTESQIQILAQT